VEIAIVGLPGSGKSTVFAAFAGRATPDNGGGRRGELERATVKVPDRRVDELAAMFKPRKVTPAEVQYVDAPELSRGGGRGTEGWSALLNHLRQADAIVQVVRAFDDPVYPHPAGSVDPWRDLGELEAEFVLADLMVIERRLERLDKEARAGKGAQNAQERALLERLKARLDEGQHLRDLALEPAEKKLLSGFGFLSAKPLMVLLNVGSDGLGEMGERLAAEAKRLGAHALAIDGKLERELVELEPADQAELLAAFDLKEPALTRAIQTSYAMLDLISFFTVGEDEVRAWTIKRGTPAVEAAGEIHSDLARGFIRAEVIGAEDLLRLGSLAEARKQGLLRSEGRNYVVQDGDVMTILFNV
jgi:GTP-binding protein YchF